MKKLLLLLIIFTSCSSVKLSDSQKQEKRKMAKEKCFILGSMIVYVVGTKIVADKQTIIK
jgi:hypothetical protein